ncbi:hypothetical protein ASPSYDRAFT_72069 [Aspergillus sydowii CBS 593.65]|uniref:Aminotransferase class I/classII domain-containing protein n=1 Tax=Aspergillus sydowii CBS 593.65 TaxID=1036612 RepID=A0A1L9T5L1_9EURO|nr:uncharacterized protein ASPSYDRAFT_72069 [Aspergillus sydowii CBS 593.65]OJJ54740.1 hypothetical protein ASPSYDRAFT_72069 [Aspergillus sydowii CBS 593.65]
MASNTDNKFILTAEALDKALHNMTMATKAIHANDFVSPHRAIAQGMHVAVNDRYERDPDNLVQMENKDPNAPFDSHIYSRYTAPNSNRLEVLLRSIFGGEVITYSSGLSAFHAAMVLLNPKRIFIGENGYHGSHGVIDVMTKLTGIQKLDLSQLDQLGPGDVVHIETPLNPTGEAPRNLAYYRDRAHERAAYLCVDATFAPPPLLQNPLDLGG